MEEKDIFCIFARKMEVDMRRFTIDITDCFLIGVLLLAFWAILSIQLKIIPTIDVGWEAVTAKSVNDVYLNLSFSYIAALIF